MFTTSSVTFSSLDESMSAKILNYKTNINAQAKVVTYNEIPLSLLSHQICSEVRTNVGACL